LWISHEQDTKIERGVGRKIYKLSQMAISIYLFDNISSRASLARPAHATIRTDLPHGKSKAYLRTTQPIP
jgi:hypothetical protein